MIIWEIHSRNLHFHPGLAGVASIIGQVHSSGGWIKNEFVEVEYNPRLRPTSLKNHLKEFVYTSNSVEYSRNRENVASS